MNCIDISKKITNELPSVKITEDLIVVVNSRKSNVLAVQAMIKESEVSAKNGKETDEFKFMDAALKTLIGKKNADAINGLDLPMPEYKTVFNAVMASCSGQTIDELEEAQKRFQK